MKKSLFVANSMTITGIVIAAIGVVAIVCGENFFKLLIQITGGAIALMGLFMLIMRIAKRNTDSKLEKTLMIIMFACAMIGGVLIFYYAETLEWLFTVVFGVIILLTAIAMLIITLSYREKKSKLSLTYLISSIVVIIAAGVIGFLFIKDPYGANKTLAIILGVIMVILGLLLLLESFMVRKVIKLFNENLLTGSQNVEVETVEAEAEVIDDTKPLKQE